MSITEEEKTTITKYFTKADLQLNHTVDSAWVSIFRDVYDITTTIQENRRKPGIDKLLRFMGKDMSHFFDPKNKLPITKNVLLVEETGHEDPNYMLHFPKKYMNTDRAENGVAWFMNNNFIIGKMSEKEVPVRIINTLTYEEDIFIVPIEENLNEICERYLKFNFHARSYTWKDIEERVLNMSLNLVKNGIAEDFELLDYLDIPEESRPVPTIFLHFNDDLTEM